jgi:O-antigen/teichoic acid export membrane protein
MSIVKNYIYNTLYQLVSIIIPIITIPYVSRVLGTDGVGEYAYTNSIVQYFIIIGTLGIPMYGNRVIAYVRDERNKLSKNFLEIFTLQIITCSISLVLYILCVVFFFKKYLIISLIQSIFILTSLIDISWLFMGLEEFKKTVTRNMVIKVLGVICIFIFVKSKNDLMLYSLILTVSAMFGQAILWSYVPKLGLDIKISYVKEFASHIIPSFELFVPQIAMQVYLSLNKTMIGSITGSVGEVGIFEQSDKVVRITLAVLTSLGTVMLPRISNMFKNGEHEKIKTYLDKSIIFVSFLAIPMMFGLMGIANSFVPWFFGEGFNKCVIVMKILSPIVIFIALTNVFGGLYLVPTGKNKEFTYSVIGGAIANFIINLFIIKVLQSIGAAIATLVSEFIVMYVQFYFVNKEIKFGNALIKEMVKYFISGFLMFSIITYMGYKMDPKAITTIIQIAVGIFAYILFIVLFNLKKLSDSELLLTFISKYKKFINKK